VSPWIPVIVTVTIFLVGLAAQGMMFAFFMGKMKTQVDSLKTQSERDAAAQDKLMELHRTTLQTIIDSLLRRMEDSDQFFTRARGEYEALKAKVEHIDRNTAGLQDLREELARLGARFDAHHEGQNQDMAAIKRDITSIQRQLATLAVSGPGKVVEWAAEGQG